jgi:hypothetical protein
MNPAWPWVVLALLGAYHGLNPAMGWLFALALGLQEKRRSAVFAALFPIALGHAAAVAVAILVLAVAQRLVPIPALKWSIAGFTFALGVYRLFRASHPRGMGMRVNRRELFGWSFLMASAHGAGLMLVPVLIGGPRLGMHHIMPSVAGSDLPLRLRVVVLSTAVHTGSMLIVAGLLAIVFFEIYERVGLKLLRHAWFNFDLVWAFGLLIAAVAVLMA